MKITVTDAQLRPAREEDLPRTVACERLYPQFVGQWTKQQHRAALADPDTAYLVVTADEDRFLGYVILRGLRTPARDIELGRIALMTPGRGIGGPVLAAVQHYAFWVLGARRLWLDMRADNGRARRACLRAGFAEDPLLRQEVPEGGRTVQLLVLSRLLEDFVHSETMQGKEYPYVQ